MDNNLEDNKISRWLDGRLSKDEKQKFENSNKLEGLKIVIEDIDTWKVKDFDLENGLKDLKKRKLKQTKQVTFLNKTWFQIAASILLIFSSYYLVDHFYNNEITIQTQITEQKEVFLPNGTEVNLDVVSSIVYNKKSWAQLRTVKLKGQAYFNVTKGAPFIVHAGNTEIKVLGTKFNINHTDELLQISCYEGKVMVTHNQQEEVLTKGKEFILHKDVPLIQFHNLDTPDWKRGYLRYNQTMLSQIIIDLEKHYSVKFQLPIAKATLKFTGKLPTHNLDLALKNLFTTMELEYNQTESGIFIIN